MVQRFLRKPLEEDGIALNADAEDDYDANDERIIELVGNGIARFETDLQVVKLDRDGDPLDVMPQGQVGEVWVASESKTIGYFKKRLPSPRPLFTRVSQTARVQRPITCAPVTWVSFRRRTGSSSFVAGRKT